jgi:hypothetical protein
MTAAIRRANLPQRLKDSALLLHRHRDVAVRRETNLVAFYVGHEAAVDVVMMASVSALATVSLGEFDAVLFDPIDGADMDAVSANYFHMLVGAYALLFQGDPGANVAMPSAVVLAVDMRPEGNIRTIAEFITRPRLTGAELRPCPAEQQPILKVQPRLRVCIRC